MINAILVDDERKPRELLKMMLEEDAYPLNVIGEASDVDEAISLIDTLSPDVVFLDISMPGGTGMDLMRKYENRSFEVVFSTAHPEYAIEAFRLHALGYLVKPFREDDVASIKQYLSGKINKKEISENTITLHLKNEIIVLNFNNLVRCEGWDKYTYFHCKDGEKHLISSNIGKFKRQLLNHSFFEVHKSHILNLNLIKSCDRVGWVEMVDGSYVPIARRRKKSFFDRLNA